MGDDETQFLKFHQQQPSEYLPEFRMDNQFLDIKPLRGGGITKHLKKYCEANNVSMLAVVWFSTEGENAPDALKMAEVVDSYLALASRK